MEHPVGHGDSNILRTWRRHWCYTEKVGRHTTRVSWLRWWEVGVGVVIDVVGHVEMNLTGEGGPLYTWATVTESEDTPRVDRCILR